MIEDIVEAVGLSVTWVTQFVLQFDPSADEGLLTE